MSYRRYHIRSGDRTTANGIVRATSTVSLTNGAPLAREGDPVDCPACNTQGAIQCVAPRLPDSCEGREHALSDDLCICRCDPPPTLVAGQRDDFQLLPVPAARGPQ